jgi:Bacterial extracellular solute-binding proteins, family 3
MLSCNSKTLASCGHDDTSGRSDASPDAPPRGSSVVVDDRWALTCVIGSTAAQTIDANKPDLHARRPDPDRLRGAWYLWDPYQYRDYRREVPILTGFDVEIERALERLIGVEILLPEILWQDHLTGIADGTMDIAGGAIYSDARSAYAYFSKPYRTETNVLIRGDRFLRAGA